MRGFLKTAALSAVLSFTLVTAYNQAWSSQPSVAGKIYQDRLAAVPEAEGVRPAASAALPSSSAGRKGDRLAPSAACADQTWPYIAPGCMAAGSAGGPSRAVRMITIEAREGENTSVLLRVPQAAVASR
jgi:hypothetical protein